MPRTSRDSAARPRTRALVHKQAIGRHEGRRAARGLDGAGDRGGIVTDTRVVQGRKRGYVEVTAVSAEDGIGRIQKIGDGAAFAHEFGVIANREILSALLVARLLENGKDDSFSRTGENSTAQHDNMCRCFLA